MGTIGQAFEKAYFAMWSTELTRMTRLKVYLLGLLTALIYHSVIVELVQAWMKNPYYNHGFLIPLISGYLVFRSKGRLKEAVTRPSLYGMVFAGFGILIFVVDRYVFKMLFFSSVGMLLFIIGGVLLILGKEHLRPLLFPILSLILMAPIPDFIFDQLFIPLQLMASRIGQIMPELLGIPVLREGIHLHLAPFSVTVDKSCSSMHSLIALSALSFIIAYMMADSIKGRALIVASSIPLAILANGFRLVLITLLALWLGKGIFDSFFHPLSGKLFFLLALSIIVFEAKGIKRIH